MKSQMTEGFKAGDLVRRTDTDRSGQVVQVIAGRSARVQWPSGQEDWLPVSLLNRADTTENEQ